MSERILLAHGSGGKAMHRLIQDIFHKTLGNEFLQQRNDAAVVSLETSGGKARLAMTTDSFVVQPLFFRGGDIGRLAVCGTVNDLATSGAKPLYLSLGLIIEEGLPVSDLERVIRSVAETCREAGVSIITGDTKVVARGQADGLYINTTGIGILPEGRRIGGEQVRPGDAVLINGGIGEHGMAVMSEREGISWETPLKSDVAPLNGLVASVLEAVPEAHCFRDPTRGGVATTLNEIAAQAEVGIEVEETAVPVSLGVRGACEMLGFDPLYVANEGKMLIFVPGDKVAAALEAMQKHVYGKGAAVIGKVTEKHPGTVLLRTEIGGERILDMLEGDMLPRIC